MPVRRGPTGIEVVYQDLALADQQPVYMNMFLGRELTRKPFGLLDKAWMRQETQSLVDQLDVRIPSASSTIRDLSGGQRQGIAIARATHWASKLILLDEPTAALGVAETAKVEELVASLKERNLAILIISHSLDQVFRLSDRICVLRRGPANRCPQHSRNRQERDHRDDHRSAQPMNKRTMMAAEISEIPEMIVRQLGSLGIYLDAG